MKYNMLTKDYFKRRIMDSHSEGEIKHEIKRKKKLRWVGHTVRKTMQKICKILRLNPQGGRKVECPKHGEE